MSNSRNYYFDGIRGLAILMVIGIHTYPNPDSDTFWGVTEICLRQLLNCAVPIFFAISGYFLVKKDFNSFEDIKMFWKKQILKVYVPTLVWSLPYFLIEILKGESIFGNILFLFVCGFGPFYFIATIIQYYVLLPIIKKIKSFSNIIPFTISLISSLVAAYYISWGGFSSLPIIFYAGPFYVWIVFFVLGTILGGAKNLIIQINYIGCFSLILMGLMIQFFELFIMHDNGVFSVGLKMSSVLFSISAIIVIFSKSNNLALDCNNRLVKLGSISFPIYLIHSYFALLVGRLSHGLIPWFLSWMLVCALSIGAVYYCKHYIPKRLHYYLGVL